VNRAEYITIGENCCLSEVTILAHDYSWFTLLESCNDLLPDAGGKVIIGNNCFIGFHSIILKNTTIGDNCIIAAGAVVKGNVPKGTVWGGCPARQICTIEEFYEKRKKQRIQDAQYRRDIIRERFKRDPKIDEMGLFCFLFLERTDENYERYIKNVEFNGVKDWAVLKHHFFYTQPVFNSFEEFLASK
jgi:carbonic anhydrase/acetyltransferase-like protein (isoleucine patch superfamily)